MLKSTHLLEIVLAARKAIQSYGVRAMEMAPTVDAFACITPTGADIPQM